MKPIKLTVWLIIVSLITSASILMLVQKSHGQPVDTNYYWFHGLYDPDANFYQVRKMGWDYFNAHPEIDTIKGTGFKNLLRWEQFWQDRVYEYGNSEAGSFNIAYEAMDDFLDHRDNYFQESFNEDLSWQFFGPDSLTTQTMGFISCIDIDVSGVNFDTIYAGTNSSGLFKTIDGGAHWTCVTDTIGLPGLGVQDVIVDPNNPSIIYIGTGITTYGRGYGLGIYKSTDGGLSWQNVFNMANPEQKVVHKMVIDPENSSRLFALVNDKVYRTVDGGQNWTLIFNSLSQPPSGNRRILQDIELRPGSSDTVYISSNGISYYSGGNQYFLTSEIWRCSNATAQDNIAWTRIDDNSWPYNDRIELAVTPVAPEKIFACFSYHNENDTFALFKSDDLGNTWNQYVKQQTNHSSYGSTFGGVGASRMELLVSPSDTDVVYVGGYFVAKITDNGQTIQSNDGSHFITNGFHVDVRELIIASGSDSGTSGSS